jgi:hypothetical protein
VRTSEFAFFDYSTNCSHSSLQRPGPSCNL